jgi:MOSC domain-containing protein YiiM
MSAAVVAVARCSTHRFSKSTQPSITLLAGLGVDGDAHAGVTVKYRSRVAADPTQPDLRQVHLIYEDLIDELQCKGFNVAPGVMGENITTRGIELLSLPTGTRLRVAPSAVIEVTGLRNPCAQLDSYQEGLMRAVLDKASNGELIRKAGVMGIVLAGGTVRPGDPIKAELPPRPHRSLERV